MNPIARSLLFAFASLLHPRMLWLMMWPMFIALAIWGTLLWVLGAQAVLLLSGWMQDWIRSGTFFIHWDLQDAIVMTAKILIFLMFIPLVWLTALLILSTFGMPAMVEHVAARRFPQLGRRHGGSIAGSIWNGVVALAGLIGLGLISIPFWLVPPLWPLIPIAIMGWLNQRVLRYDALAEHASSDEMRRIFASRRGTLFAMGAILALLAYVPFVGFVAPVLFGLAFIHLLLGELEALRQAPIEGEVARL
ncbi:MAG TPA: EI24 domain-containing protein [Burkholderiales bacterium]|nr:EI24 domain-containing protein [Burkholderiales bacterium]